MKRCVRCILPTTFPGISFDEQGLCNYCRRYKGDKVHDEIKKKYENKFIELKDSLSRNTTYDLIMAYSGGKDSTYTLDIFINRYKLRVLALTLDNTFISEKSFQNMRKVCENLDVDHQIIRPNPKMLGKIFKTAAEKELFSPKTLERASTICTCCIGFVKSSILRTAIEKDIPFAGFGWSPGQAPVQASVMKTNASLMQTTQKAIYDPLYKIAGSEINPYFLFDEHFHQKERFPWNIHPLAFLNYDEENIIARIKDLGWEMPEDTDANSTNCLLNAFANKVHKDRYDFHPYVWELANMVRNGSMERAYAITKIETPENETFVNYARNKLDI
jgi:tRNA(Ile)-lysidine synthase TilS/MesJ